MAGHDHGKHCYHCKQWIEEGEAHNCWTTTEAALTRDLPEDLQEAYQRVRETAAAFGDQRIYASLNSIMFSRKACYLFVRPKKTFLEVCVFLGRPLRSPHVRRAEPASRTKFANMIRIQHRDEVEAPITDWMQEAYEQSDALSAAGRKGAGPTPTRPAKKKAAARKTATGTKKKRRVSSRSASSTPNRRR